MTAEVEGIYAPKIQFAIDRTGWWITERYHYIMLWAREGKLAALADGRWPSGDEAAFAEVYIRLPASAAKADLPVPGDAQGFAFIGVPGAWPMAWRFSNGMASIHVTEEGHMIAAKLDLVREWPRSPSDARAPKKPQTLVLSTTVVPSSDRGIPAYLFVPQNVRLLPELNRWIEEDPDLRRLVVPSNELNTAEGR